MIEANFNKEGLCDGYLEWTLVNEEGKLDNQGLFLYIKKMWTHKSNGLGKELGKRVFAKAPNVLYVYWKRKRNHRFTQVTKRKLLEKL